MDVLFELTSLDSYTGRPAIDYLREALEGGAHGITANKGAVLHGYRELSDLASRVGRCFLPEATCMGGVPVSSLFRETLPAARLVSFEAILNATTTVVLDSVAWGRSLEGAVREAQALGIAETDPGADLDGWDAAVKVAAMVTVLMDTPLRLDEGSRRGIRHLSVDEVRAAFASGTPYRPIGRARREAGRVIASVRPGRVDPSGPFGGIRGTSLALRAELDVVPGFTLTAHNPNAEATAYDVMADVVAATRAPAPP